MEESERGGSAIMAANLLTFHVDKMATKKITFTERWESKHIMRGSKGGLVRAERATLRSQEGVSLSTGRKTLSRPLRKQWSDK